MTSAVKQLRAATAAWQANVRKIAEDREVCAFAIEAECGGRESLLTACMKLFVEVGFALGGGRRPDWDPKRILAQNAASRDMLRWLAEARTYRRADGTYDVEPPLRALAETYRDIQEGQP